MTREEAIETLKGKAWICCDEKYVKTYEEALDIAIEALEQEPCDKCEVGNPCLYCKHEFDPQESEGNMANIELVIKIPESQYKTLNAKTQEDVVDVIDDKTLIDAIKSGVPLPKGHGDLKDVGQSILIIDTPKTCGDCPLCIFSAEEKRHIGFCNTSNEDYYCKVLDRFMEYDRVDGGIDILGKPTDCPLNTKSEDKE